jgi:hypothetical protein
MLVVTDRAGQELRELLGANSTEPKHVLRIDYNVKGFIMWIGEEMEGDVLVGSEETAVLHASPQLSEVLERISMVVDCVDTNEGQRLVIYREEEGQPGECCTDCGCGCECDSDSDCHLPGDCHLPEE